jgi:hypothetical protein
LTTLNLALAGTRLASGHFSSRASDEAVIPLELSLPSYSLESLLGGLELNGLEEPESESGTLLDEADEAEIKTLDPEDMEEEAPELLDVSEAEEGAGDAGGIPPSALEDEDDPGNSSMLPEPEPEAQAPVDGPGAATDAESLEDEKGWDSLWGGGLDAQEQENAQEGDRADEA